MSAEAEGIRAGVLGKHDAGILGVPGKVTEVLPGQTNRPVETTGDKQVMGAAVTVSEWNDFEIIARVA